MTTMRPALIASFILIALPHVRAFGQGDIEISGRLVAPDRTPLPDRVVEFRNVTKEEQVKGDTLMTDAQGIFTCVCKPRTTYQIFLPGNTAASNKGVAAIEVTEGHNVMLGDISLGTSAQVDGPLKIGGPRKSAALIAVAATTCAPGPYEFCGTSRVHIVLDDGVDVEPAPDGGQLNLGTTSISETRQAAGWLAEDAGCCASYPQYTKVFVYRPGKPLRGFTGDGRIVQDWHFAAGGRQIALCQAYPHGEPFPHFELRDIASGRPIAKWDGEFTAKMPEWARGLRF